MHLTITSIDEVVNFLACTIEIIVEISGIIFIRNNLSIPNKWDKSTPRFCLYDGAAFQNLGSFDFELVLAKLERFTEQTTMPK